MMPLEGKPSLKEHRPMSHDLIFALVFIIMIAAPALVTTTSDRDERDPL
jgi:hypothetical protein